MKKVKVQFNMMFNIYRIKKTFLVVCASLLSFSSFAQEISLKNNSNSATNQVPSKSVAGTGARGSENQIKNIASVNGLIVGYAIYCSIDPQKSKLIHDKFYALVAKAQSSSVQEVMVSEYEQKVKLARQNGPSYSGVDCAHIVKEVQKISNMIADNRDKLFEENGVVIRKSKDKK